MPWFSIIAVYVLFWTLSALIVLQWGVRSHDEDEGAERVAGQVTSAPVNWRPGKVILRATLLSTVLCGVFFANRYYGWITAEKITDLVPMPASLQSGPLYH